MRVPRAAAARAVQSLLRRLSGSCFERGAAGTLAALWGAACSPPVLFGFAEICLCLALAWL